MNSIYSKTSKELSAYFSSGESLDRTDAMRCEHELELNAHDFIARLRLAGFFSAHMKEFKSQYFQQVLWFIEHYPDVLYQEVLDPFRIVDSPSFSCQELFSTIRAKVESQPNNLTILINAAYLTVNSDHAFARDCVIRARESAPNNKSVVSLIKDFNNLENAMKKTGLFEDWDGEPV
jgi:hypothetical protein